jgi:hypothetical protein
MEEISWYSYFNELTHQLSIIFYMLFMTDKDLGYYLRHSGVRIGAQIEQDGQNQFASSEIMSSDEFKKILEGL